MTSEAGVLRRLVRRISAFRAARASRKRKVDDLAEALLGYVPLLRNFIDGSADLESFEQDFFAKYLNDKTPFSTDVFETLDEFFFAVDSCTPHPEQQDPKFRPIGPDELRERAIALLREGGYEV